MNRNLKKAVIETNPSEAVFVTALFSWRHCFRGGIVFVAALFSWQHDGWSRLFLNLKGGLS